MGGLDLLFWPLFCHNRQGFDKPVRRPSSWPFLYIFLVFLRNMAYLTLKFQEKQRMTGRKEEITKKGSSTKFLHKSSLAKKKAIGVKFN